MKVSPHTVKYGLVWLDKRGQISTLGGFDTRLAAENHGANHLTVHHNTYGYVPKS